MATFILNFINFFFDCSVGRGGDYPRPFKQLITNKQTNNSMKTHSLAEFLADKDTELKPITLIVDGSQLGIKKDAAGILYILPTDTATQGMFFAEKVKAVGLCPRYVCDHLKLIFNKTCVTDADCFEFVLTILEGNTQARNVVGLITLLEGYFSGMRRENKFVPVYIETPEAGLHPNVQSALAEMFVRIDNKYNTGKGVADGK